MDVLLEWQHYHRSNVILLSAIGLWPYGNKLVLRLKRFVGSFFATGCCVTQLATFFTVDYTRKLLLRNVPCIFVGCGILLKYISFLGARDAIKGVTETINGEWKNLSNKEEVRIIEKYIGIGKFHTIGFAMFICPLGLCLFLAPWSTLILDIVMPLNQSRHLNFPIMFELFLDQQKHCFISTALFDGAVVVAAIVFVSTETLFILYIQYACALFEVTRHCKTIKNDFLPSYIILLAFGVLSLGAHLFRCTQTFASHELAEFLTSAMFCLAILGYMFYLNFVVQSVLDSSVNIFSVLYDSAWYAFPVSTQKFVLFCMLNCMKPVAVDCCSIFLLSYEGFSVIVKMTMSYATALYSFQ